MKTIATIAASIALSLSVLAIPVHADEPVPNACSESQDREELLRHEIADLVYKLKTVNAVVEQADAAQNATIDAQRGTIASQGETIARQRAKIQALRAKLRAKR